MLTPLIGDIVAAHNHHMSDLEGVCVSKGPGSFTGLRIGVSTAKGLCYGLDVPLIGVETFEAMVVANRSAMKSEGVSLVAAVAPSRKGESYWQVWSVRESVQSVTVAASDSVAEIEEALASMTQKLTRLGFGPLADVTPREPVVAGVAELGWQAFDDGRFENVALFEPYYLKEFVAKKGGSPFHRLPF